MPKTNKDPKKSVNPEQENEKTDVVTDKEGFIRNPQIFRPLNKIKILKGL